MAIILIVDDHVLNREFLTTLLGYGGHQLLEAADGIEGLRMVHAAHPDLVIADILMPHMDGYAFVTHMREDPDPDIAATAVMFYTAAYREREATVMALACGVRWVLPKPSEPGVILETVHQALGLPAVRAPLPALTQPPPEGSRFVTVENQLTEYLVEIETNSQLISQIAHGGETGGCDLEQMALRLSKSLSSLQAVSLRLTALIELGIELAAEREVEHLLETGCRTAQNICVARYAAIGILGEDGRRLGHFVSCGLNAAMRTQLGTAAAQSALSRLLRARRLPHRVTCADGDPCSVGLPSCHPAFNAVLAVPIASRQQVYGWLCLAGKLGADAFSEVDERAAATVASQLAVAYESLLSFEKIERQHAQLKMEMDERIQAEHTLQETEEKLSGILNSIDNVVWSASGAGLLYLNPVAERVYGRPLAEFFQGRDMLFDAIHPEDREQVICDEAILLRQGAVTKEYRILRPDGAIRWLEQRSKAVRDAGGRLLRIDAVASDITERKEYEARIEYLAEHDALTDLANRHMLGDRVTQSMRQARRTGESLLALLFLDLDRFKSINDSYGHTVGDMLLRSVAERLLETVRAGDTVARQGGDEFIILLVGLHDPQDVVRAVSKIVDAFAAPFTVAGHQLHMTTSIGVTVFPGDGDDMSTLLRNADTAMYRAKEDNGNTYQFYSREMSVRAIERAGLENALRVAIERQEFELFYQPKVDIRSGQVIGAEALIRWHHPELGLVEPQRFIPLAEEVGLIVLIGDWVIRSAHAQNKAWQDAGLPPLNMAVNLSVRQFLQDGLVETVAGALRDTGLDGRYLELELTESMVMNNAEHFIIKLHRLKALGVQLSIDDFGTGYSSLSYLKRFPIDRLKIDQSFIRDIATNPHDAAIVRSVIEMGHNLNFRVIAEGVENSEQLAFLRANRCDEFQGYYFSEPRSAGEFAALFGAGWQPRDGLFNQHENP